MTAAEALVLIRQHAAARRVVITDHAADQMLERDVTLKDIYRALAFATKCRAGDEAGKWEVRGIDATRAWLTVIVALRNGNVVVTVYRKGRRTK